MMEHFVVKDVFDHKARNGGAVQHRMNPYDSFVHAVAPETDGPGPAPSFPHPPGDGTTEPSSEIDRVEVVETVFQVDMFSLRTKARSSRLHRGIGRPDLLFVTPDEGSQQTLVPDRRPPNERRKRSQHIFRRIEEHLMKPDPAGPVSPSHRDHGSRVVREGERQRDVKKRLQS
jgi:hypothetical protein